MAGERIEVAVRPFQTPTIVRAPRPAPERPVPGADGAASFRHGAPSRFQANNTGGGFRLNEPVEDFGEVPLSDEELETRDAGVHREVNRKVSTVRVENPNDSNQFVIVERIDEITFQAPDGRLNTFVLNN